MMKIGVTTGKNTSTGLVQEAVLWSEQLGLSYIERTAGTLEQLLQDCSLDALLLATARGPELHSAGGRLFFHPGMGLLRAKNILAGQGDRFIDVTGLQAGMSLLDCSFGLGADAAVAAFVAGSTGKVVALEASPIVAFVMQEGMKRYNDNLLRPVLPRIQLVAAEAFAYLCDQPDNAFDVVYFDPMFDYEVDRSSNMRPLRPLAYKQAVAKNFLEQAKRVAAKRVVLKSVRNSRLFKQFALQPTPDGRYSKVKYAVIEVEK